MGNCDGLCGPPIDIIITILWLTVMVSSIKQPFTIFARILVVQTLNPILELD